MGGLLAVEEIFEETHGVIEFHGLDDRPWENFKVPAVQLRDEVPFLLIVYYPLELSGESAKEDFKEENRARNMTLLTLQRFHRHLHQAHL